MASQTFQHAFVDRFVNQSAILELLSVFRNSIGSFFDHRKRSNKQAKFPDQFLHQLFQHCLKSESILKYSALELVFVTAKAQFQVDKHFRQVEKVVFETFHDDLIDDGVADITAPKYEFFMKSFETNISLNNNMEMKKAGQQFLKSLRKFAPLLILEDGLVQCEKDVQICLKLLRFFRHIKHLSLYIRYVHELFNYHMKKKNYVESAITLYQESLLMGWDAEKIPEVSDAVVLPTKISEFELNQQIHLMCIKLLDLGKNWERAIELTRVLEEKYEEAMDFQKLAEILRLRVSLLEKILYDHRSFPTYYRILFKGDGFPNEIRGKNFIYRGEDWEQIGSFCERLAIEYAPVQIVSSQSGRYHVKHEEKDRIIEVNVVKPVSDVRNWCVQDKAKIGTGVIGAISWSVDKEKSQEIEDLPMWIFSPELYWEESGYRSAVKIKESLSPSINQFYDSNEVSMFMFSRPLNENLPDSQLDFTNSWTENTVLFAENQLPFVSRTAKVVKAIVFKTSPIENAIIAVRNVTKDLVILHAQYSNHNRNARESILRSDSRFSLDSHQSTKSETQNLSMNPFTMKLAGVVNSPINGGIENYKSAFLNNKAFYTVENEPYRQKLFDSILDQVLWINRSKLLKIVYNSI